MLTRRSALAWLGVAPLVVPVPARAQARPSATQLQTMIAQALRDPETVTFARPQPLGFTEKVVTHQLGYTHGAKEFYFAVTNPRLRDGLIFFSHEPARRLYIMHRTDTHLRRVSSARNDLSQGNAGLVTWGGPQADADFAEQLAYWATRH